MFRDVFDFFNVCFEKFIGDLKLKYCLNNILFGGDWLIYVLIGCLIFVIGVVVGVRVFDIFGDSLFGNNLVNYFDSFVGE